MVTLIFCILAGLFNGLINRISFHWSSDAWEWMRDKAHFWNPKDSWKNKYKDGDPKKGERFLFSSTLLVSLTDGWHLLKLLTQISMTCAVVFYPGSSGLIFETTILRIALDFVLCYWVFELGFFITYKLL